MMIDRRNSQGLRDRMPDGDETLIVDARGGLTPSQVVENKLMRLLDAAPLLVSHVQFIRFSRTRQGNDAPSRDERPR
jgi:hypothetical protein